MRRQRATGCLRLAKAIRVVLKSRGRSVTDLAGSINVGRSRLSQWINGHRQIDRVNFRKISDALNVDISGINLFSYSPHHGEYWCRGDMTAIAVTCRSTSNTLYTEGKE